MAFKVFRSSPPSTNFAAKADGGGQFLLYEAISVASAHTPLQWLSTMNSLLKRALTIADFLSAEYAMRAEQNPAYSMRAFARDLGLSKSHLNDVINSKRGISATSAAEIAKALDLDGLETTCLIALAEKDFGRTQKKRDASASKLEKLRSRSQASQLSIERFKIISDWFHLAILELSRLTEFHLDPTYVSRVLGISRETAASAIDRMVSAGFAEVRGGNLITADIMHVASDAPSDAVRSFHRQIIDKARTSIEEQDLDRRLLSTHLNAVAKADLPRARSKILEFTEQFNEEFGSTSSPDRLYALSIQFFDLMVTNE